MLVFCVNPTLHTKPSVDECKMSRYVFLILLNLWLGQAKNYENYKLYQIDTSGNFGVNYLGELQEKLNLDFWDHKTVLVAPGDEKELLWYATQNNLVLKVLNDNIQRNIQAEKIHILSQRPKAGEIDFKNYHRYSTIISYLKRLEKDYPKSTSLETIGKSYEGREIYAIRVSSGGTNGTKPVIFVDAGIHAREWIAPATALYLIQQLVEDTKNSVLYQKFDWYIIPLVNPDGYEYTHTNDRFWRKTRSKGTKCDGADANRNYGFKWGQVGSSADECSLTYRGKSAFSESETRAVRDLALKHQKNIKLYLTLHSYGQYLLHPWGHTGETVQGVEDIVKVAKSANDAIKSVNGTTYKIGSSAALLGLMSGSSRDYFAGEISVKYSYTVELPGGGTQGFDLPPSRIYPVVKETFEGIKTFWKEINTIYL